MNHAVEIDTQVSESIMKCKTSKKIVLEIVFYLLNKYTVYSLIFGCYSCLPFLLQSRQYRCRIQCTVAALLTDTKGENKWHTPLYQVSLHWVLCSDNRRFTASGDSHVNDWWSPKQSIFLLKNVGFSVQKDSQQDGTF